MNNSMVEVEPGNTHLPVPPHIVAIRESAQTKKFIKVIDRNGVTKSPVAIQVVFCLQNMLNGRIKISIGELVIERVNWFVLGYALKIQRLAAEKSGGSHADLIQIFFA